MAMAATMDTAQTSLPEITRGTVSHGPTRQQPRRGLSFRAMSSDDPSAEELRRRQREQERVERDQIADSDTGAEADRHRRRADKAAYLQRKLEQRQRAERDAEDGPNLPPAA
jgi:hypothetical protein